MRVLNVTPARSARRTIRGAGERYALSLCQAVAAAEPDGGTVCDVLSFGSKPAVIGVLPRTDLRVLAGSPEHPASCSTPAFHGLLDSYDVIHVHQCLLPFGLYVAARARLRGKRVIGTAAGEGAWPALEPFPVMGELFDAFHAPSDFAAHAFAHLARPVVVIKGPVDDRAFTLGQVPRDRSAILSTGPIVPSAGLDSVIDALPDHCALVIAGQPDDRNYLKHLRNQARGRGVSFRTNLDDAALLRCFHQAGILVQASTHTDYQGNFWPTTEPAGLEVLEGMATGVAAIVSSAGALAEFASFTGCHVYRAAGELPDLLAAHAAGDLPPTDPQAIRNGIVANFGLIQFGRRYLDLLRAV